MRVFKRNRHDDVSKKSNHLKFIRDFIKTAPADFKKQNIVRRRLREF